MTLRSFALLAITALSTSCSTAHIPPSEPAAGNLAQIEVIDRTNGVTLPVYWHRGERWIAGTPGHRYAIAVRNRSGGRILTVIAVDGVNAVSGETVLEQKEVVTDARIEMVPVRDTALFERYLDSSLFNLDLSWTAP